MSAGHSTGTSAAVTGGVDTGAEPPTPAPAPTALSAQQQHQHQPQHRPTPVNNTGAGPGSSTSISTSTVAPDLLLAAKIQAPPSPTVAAQDYSNSINNNNTDFSSSTATIRHITDDQPASDPAVSSSLTTTRQTRFSDRRSSVLSPTAVSAPDDRPHDTSASPESHLRDLGREQIVIPSIETQISPGQPPRTANTDNESLANSGPVPFEERLQRSSTFPLATPVKSPGDQYSSPTESETSPSYTRRAPASRSSQGHGYRKSDGPPISLRTRIHATDRPASYVTSPEASPHETAQGQRELLLPKALSSDERRAQRPPLSYKPPGNVPSDQLPSPNPVRVPPIRGFRSSGSRRSLTLDMNNNSRTYEGDEPADPNYDRTLRALEGRHIAGVLQMTPPASARRDGSDADDGGDVFLRIAREEGSRRNTNENVPDETQSMVVSAQSAPTLFPRLGPCLCWLGGPSLESATWNCRRDHLACRMRQACIRSSFPASKTSHNDAVFVARLRTHANSQFAVASVPIASPSPLDECRIISAHFATPSESAAIRSAGTLKIQT